MTNKRAAALAREINATANVISMLYIARAIYLESPSEFVERAVPRLTPMLKNIGCCFFVKSYK